MNGFDFSAPTVWLSLILAFFLGAALALVLAQRRNRDNLDAQQHQLRAQAEREQGLVQAQLEQQQQTMANMRSQALQWREALDTARDERAQWQERASRIAPLEQHLQQSQQHLHVAEQQIASLQSRLAALEAESALEKTNAQEKLQFLEQARESLTAQFQHMAQTILEEKSQRFSEQNQEKLGQLLDPLRSRLQEFQGRVELFYDAEGKQRAALSQQVNDLVSMNRQLSDEAHNLTQALKGSNKLQGNWGEMLLERVLEQAGFREGSDYRLQESFALDGGKRAQPDLILDLPQERHLVLDAKISLAAYERFASLSTDDSEASKTARKLALRQHIDSVRAHIKGLSERNYQQLHNLQTLDFVILFVPIEPAFMLAIGEDTRISQEAWERNVLLATPSTLLFVLRTIAHLWRQEAQSRNAQEIAKRGAELYDKLSAFASELEKVGTQLRLAQNAYDGAMNRLSTQKGNVIRQAEMLKELGVRPSKKLPASLLSQAMEQGDALKNEADAPAAPTGPETNTP